MAISGYTSVAEVQDTDRAYLAVDDGASGFLDRNATGLVLKRQFGAAGNVTTTDPGVGDDTADGYRAGSLWLNTTDGGVFVCTDPSAGAAVWTELAVTGLSAGDDAADLGSGAATDGHVLTADGAGGAAWEAVPAASGGSLAWYDVTSATYGATGDGTTDDTTAVQAAITAAEAAGGGVVYLPPGTYKITSGLTIDASNVTLRGDGLSSIIAPNFATGNIILAGTTTPNAVKNIRFQNFAINSSVARTADAAIYCQYAARYVFEDVYIQSDAETVGLNHQYNGIVLDKFDNVIITRCFINIAAWGVYAFGLSDQTWGANLWINGGGRIYAGSTSGSFGVILRGACGGVVIEDIDIIEVGVGVRLDNDVATVKNREVFINQCFIDSLVTDGIVLATNAVEVLQVDGCHISGASGAGGSAGCGIVTATTTQSATMKVSVNGGRIWNCDGTGIYITKGAWNISGVMIHDNGQAAGGGHGIFMDANVADVVISGCSITGNGNATVGYGIVGTSGMDNFAILNNLIRGNGQGDIHNDAGISSTKQLANNGFSGWTTYTPTWAAAGGTPTIGNGTLVGKYKQNGDTVTAFVELTIGSTTSMAGTSTWTFSLPANAAATGFVGPSVLYDAGGNFDLGSALISAVGVMAVIPEGGVTVGATTPFTWATGDILRAQVTYDLA